MSGGEAGTGGCGNRLWFEGWHRVSGRADVKVLCNARTRKMSEVLELMTKGIKPLRLRREAPLIH